MCAQALIQSKEVRAFEQEKRLVAHVDDLGIVFQYAEAALHDAGSKGKGGVSSEQLEGNPAQ